jgi:hypothetical protein
MYEPPGGQKCRGHDVEIHTAKKAHRMSSTWLEPCSASTECLLRHQTNFCSHYTVLFYNNVEKNHSAMMETMIQTIKQTRNILN